MSVNMPAARPPKSVGTAYLWWFLLGLVGGHQFYLGKIGRGIAYLLTIGFLGIGWFIDLFTLPSQVRMANALHMGRGGVAVGQAVNVTVQAPPTTPQAPQAPQQP